MRKIISALKLFMMLIAIHFIVGCSNQESYQGYAEGEIRYIASNFAGILETLPVQRGTSVKAGQNLFVLQQQPESDSRNQAVAQLSQAFAQKNAADAGLILAKITWERDAHLLPKGAIDKQTVDAARASYDQAIAQVSQTTAQIASAEATLQQAVWSQGQKSLYAPVDAMVFDTYFLPGEYVPAGYPVVAILAPQDIKMIFYIPETELATIKLGQVVHVNCDNCRKNIKAAIQFISPTAEYTPPVIYSDETRAKLVFRIEAIPLPPNQATLHPGQPVWITYEKPRWKMLN